MSENKEKDPDRGATDVAEQVKNTGRPVAAKKAGAKTPKAKTDPAAGAAEQAKDAGRPVVADAVVKIGKKLLAANPAMEVVYMTSDGCGFYSENDAQGHARTLTNKAVTPVKQ